jgi:protein-L-isoaspartate(D-aspartate) O-methyltransferase
MARIPRDVFIGRDLQCSAWENVALAIPHGQTISQPFVVALMSQSLALDGSERVLEVGTGSGYQAAVLSELAREVITIERIPALAAAAIARFDTLAIRTIISIVGDGSDGWGPGAPYDAIMVTAGARQVPAELLAQLSPEHGRMVIPVGPSDGERLTLVRMSKGELSRQDLGSVRFVPLIRDHIQEQES